MMTIVCFSRDVIVLECSVDSAIFVSSARWSIRSSTSGPTADISLPVRLGVISGIELSLLRMHSSDSPKNRSTLLDDTRECVGDGLDPAAGEAPSAGDRCDVEPGEWKGENKAELKAGDADRMSVRDRRPAPLSETDAGR